MKKSLLYLLYHFALPVSIFLGKNIVIREKYTQFIVYYSKSANDLYVYLDEQTAADIGMESGWTLAIPLLESAGFSFIYKGIIYNKIEADFTSTETDYLNMYLLFLLLT